MAAHPIVVIDDGTVHIPEQFRNDPRFQDGATLELVPVAPSAARAVASEKPKGDWRRLRGALAHLDVRLTDEMEQERQRDNERDAKMMSGNG